MQDVVTHTRKKMKLLRKTWFKIVISLLAGGIISEIIHISTGDPNRPMEFNPTLIFAVILYFSITFGFYLYDFYKVKADSKKTGL